MDTSIEQLRKGTIKLHSLESEMAASDAVRTRRRFIEEETGAPLEYTGRYTIPEEYTVKHNIENMIGCIQIPVGVAGPLAVKGEYARGAFYIPLATTEGALAASVNRGCSAVSKAGGAEARVFSDGMSRAPVFAADSISHAADAASWIENNLPLLKEAAEATTSHGKLKSVSVYTAGCSVYVRMVFDTGLSMGMNMATIAAEAAAHVISENTGLRLVAASGNLCCDKKPAAVNLIEGRGKTVSAGVFLTDEILKSVLKTDAESLFEVHVRKNLEGSARAGAFGFNAHAANILAAVFIATGQDPAHVVEGSSCMTTMERRNGGLYAAVTLPSLQIGVLGGGTALPCQRECIALLGCADGNENNAKKFAEITASAVLAGEISLLAALAAGKLGSSHKKLARG
ncbi:MAG: hydroxymethylglutaryl-CoA reductase (NADPH) [Methanocorpusculum sp.]|nr:hydroxymethylglutaryl-CoA reductase (NADPH) [Methanocorpusculum sp.]